MKTKNEGFNKLMDDVFKEIIKEHLMKAINDGCKCGKCAEKLAELLEEEGLEDFIKEKSSQNPFYKEVTKVTHNRADLPRTLRDVFPKEILDTQLNAFFATVQLEDGKGSFNVMVGSSEEASDFVTGVVNMVKNFIKIDQDLGAKIAFVIASELAEILEMLDKDRDDTQ